MARAFRKLICALRGGCRWAHSESITVRRGAAHDWCPGCKTSRKVS